MYKTNLLSNFYNIKNGQTILCVVNTKNRRLSKQSIWSPWTDNLSWQALFYVFQGAQFIGLNIGRFLLLSLIYGLYEHNSVRIFDIVFK